MFSGSMKIYLFIFAFGCLAVFGCRSSVRLEAIKNADPDGYLVVGEVQKPDPIASHGSQKTLLTLLSDAGGLRELAYTKKIQIIHSGVTNTVSYWPIKNGKAEDPLVPRGSTVLVKRALPPF